MVVFRLQNAFKENGPDLAGVAAAQQYSGVGTPADPNSDLAKMTRERNRLRDQLAKVSLPHCQLNRMAVCQAHLYICYRQVTQALPKLRLTMTATNRFFLVLFAERSGQPAIAGGE